MMQPGLSTTVTTHAEQVVTFEVVYYDANYNRGTASLTQTTDGSTVIVDRTPPVVNVSIASNNSVTSLARRMQLLWRLPRKKF